MQQKVEVVKFQKLWPLGQSDVFNVHWSEPAAVCNEKYKILTESCWAGLIQPVMMVTRVWSLYLMICFTVKTRPHSQLSSVYSILVLNIEHKPCMMIISQTYWRWRLCFQQLSRSDARCKYFFWLLTSTLQYESHCSDHHQLCRHHSLLSVQTTRFVKITDSIILMTGRCRNTHIPKSKSQKSLWIFVFLCPCFIVSCFFVVVISPILQKQ